MSRSVARALALLPLAAIALCLAEPGASRAAEAGGSPFPEGTRVADAALGEIRGGFDLSGGITVRFGIDMVAAIGGQTVAGFSINGSGITQTATALGGGGLKSIDPATVTNVVPLQNGVLTVLNNAQSDVVLKAVRTLNIDIYGMANAVRHAAALRAIADAGKLSLR